MPPKAKPDPPANPDEPIDPSDEPEEPDAPDAPEAPDAEAFLAQVQERAHKGAAEGTKAGMDEWVKGVVAEADLDAIDKDIKDGKGSGRGSAGPGGPGQRGGAGVKPAAPSFGQALLELAIGKPRSKPDQEA